MRGVAAKFPVLNAGAAGRGLSAGSGLLSAAAGGMGVTLPVLLSASRDEAMPESSPENVDQTESAVLLRNEHPANNIAAAITPRCERRINMRTNALELHLL